jgi:hypothetical protein
VQQSAAPQPTREIIFKRNFFSLSTDVSLLALDLRDKKQMNVRASTRREWVLEACCELYKDLRGTGNTFPRMNDGHMSLRVS